MRVARYILPIFAAFAIAACTPAVAEREEAGPGLHAPMIAGEAETARGVHELGVWLVGVQAAHDADVAALMTAVVEQQRVSAAPDRSSGSTGVSFTILPRPVSAAPDAPTGECGGATNGADRYIARESGGNPGVWNTGGSGAWGCYQIMPGTWRSSCSDLGEHGSASADVQAECASRLPLSAWGG